MKGLCSSCKRLQKLSNEEANKLLNANGTSIQIGAIGTITACQYSGYKSMTFQSDGTSKCTAYDPIEKKPKRYKIKTIIELDSEFTFLSYEASVAFDHEKVINGHKKWVQMLKEKYIQDYEKNGLKVVRNIKITDTEEEFSYV